MGLGDQKVPPTRQQRRGLQPPEGWLGELWAAGLGRVLYRTNPEDGFYKKLAHVVVEAGEVCVNGQRPR